MSSRVITVKVELVTRTHRILGQVRTEQRRLSDILNLERGDSIVVQDAVTTAVDDPHGTPVQRDLAHVIKQQIAFGIPHEPPSTPQERQKLHSFDFIEKERHQVVISVPPFAISGWLHLLTDANIWMPLRGITEIFLPITEARAVHTARSDLSWAAETIIVNRKRAHVFWARRKA
jgi:hypothetical protein